MGQSWSLSRDKASKFMGGTLLGGVEMKVINAEELKEKLNRGDDFKLVMTLDRDAYERLHVPGSLHFDNIMEAITQLDPRDEVVVYCSNRLCSSSINAYLLLRSYGFDNLYRFAGGLEEWSDAGYPLEGSMAKELAMR
jgi:rhodanese-related sulfurtransferase